MLLHRTPHGPLGLLVEHVWLHDGPLPAHATDRVLPTGVVQLVLDLRDAYAPVVVGPSTASLLVETERQHRTMGVVFRPGGAAALLGAPLDALHGLELELGELWGPAAGELHERAVTGSDHQARLEALEALLDARLRRVEQPPHPATARAVALLQATPHRITVGSLAERLGLTTRRLQQVFRTDVGISPKGYQRLQRFRGALGDLDRGAEVGWSAFALEHGFADQSHLIEEFRAHADLTPLALAAARRPFPNHVARA
jgi:AraC-like DNA-binding protein